ncbi:MAG: membrane protein insertion efficiency factor YidD [Candidatus Omnitrophica bacterium]|nr:membrane protein insertion efficiency factor YidD [Candidatus Omnitrophota bacterium]MBU1933264.1 membrane protein insertion efficiency factor YidD [Candidatus Omnitrophota bacterium]
MYLNNTLKNIIRFYHNYLSPFMLCKCRYYPSCSEYAIDAIEDRGVLMGLIKAGSRILRCNPLFPGGYDPYKNKER